MRHPETTRIAAAMLRDIGQSRAEVARTLGISADAIKHWESPKRRDAQKLRDQRAAARRAEKLATAQLQAEQRRAEKRKVSQ